MYNERLLIARERKGITQKKISELLGIKQQQYARYEKGINIMPITYLKPICIILDISANYIIGLNNKVESYK